MQRPRASKAPISNPPPVETNGLASATECTGLTPAAVQTPEEARHYAHMYDIHRQKTAWAAETKKSEQQ